MTRSPWGPRAAAALVVLASTWPLWTDLGLRPCETDDVLWVARTATSNPDWFSWVFRQSHFVGYRPVPAVSFLLDWVLSGSRFVAPVYHGTDLLLHACTVAAVYPLFRALFPTLPRWGGALATAVFAAHPAVTEVVPWLSRRSYVLGTLASALSLWCAARGRTTLSTAAFAAAVLSNETAFLAGPVLLALAATQAGVRGLRRAWAVPVVAVGVFVTRLGIVGKVGGYTFDDRGPARILGVMREALAYLWVPTHAPEAASTAGFLAAAAAGLFYLIQGIRLPGGRLACLWLAGSVLLIGATQTWFYRLSYPMLLPLGLLVGAVAASTRSVWAALPQVGLLAWLLGQSPLLRGPPAAALQARVEADARLAGLEAVLAPGLGPTDLLLVTPYTVDPDVNPWWNSGSRWKGKHLRAWGLFQARGTRTDVRQLALVRLRRTGVQPTPLVPTDDPTRVVFPKGTELYLWPEVKEDRRVLTEPVEVPRSEMKIRRKRAAMIYFVPPLAGGVVRLEPASDDAPAAPSPEAPDPG